MKSTIRIKKRSLQRLVFEIDTGGLTAIVVDGRPTDQRRVDLSGRLCDLDH